MLHAAYCILQVFPLIDTLELIIGPLIIAPGGESTAVSLSNQFHFIFLSPIKAANAMPALNTQDDDAVKRQILDVELACSSLANHSMHV